MAKKLAKNGVTCLTMLHIQLLRAIVQHIKTLTDTVRCQFLWYSVIYTDFRTASELAYSVLLWLTTLDKNGWQALLRYHLKN